MYKYRISTNLAHDAVNVSDEKCNLVSLLKPEYVKLNSSGFADLLSCCLETTTHIRWAKDKIENIKEPVWEEIKKATNPYELIYAAPNMAIANVKPLSRSFLKMIEMIHEFADGACASGASNGGIMQLEELVSLHIAEGPGGFIEATRYIRNSHGYTNDTAFGITLNNKNEHGENVNNIPAWRQSNYFLRNHPEVIISYGADGTGNIYNPDNINHLADEINTVCQKKYTSKPVYLDAVGSNIAKVYVGFGDECLSRCMNQSSKNMFASLEVENMEQEENLVEQYEESGEEKKEKNEGNKEYGNRNGGYALFITADGGFDYSINYNYQEQASSKLIFSQIITALKCQALGGTFICKFFEMNLVITIEMLYILHTVYNEVIIYKPFTSRVANSEKYLVCCGFKGIGVQMLDRLLSILADWNTANLEGKTINRLMIDIPNYFIVELKRINRIIISQQIDIINSIMHIYRYKLNLDSEWKKENYKKQRALAVEWCQKYNIPWS